MMAEERESNESLLIYTVGHSTRRQEEFIALLREFGVETLIDIRHTPYSRYNPQFNREELTKALPEAGIGYVHFEVLGGRRPAPEVMQKAKSCSERSRGFAAYMRTPEFKGAIDRVIVWGTQGRIALMCAESDPSHCHRFWVSDALVERGVDVRHIIRPGTVEDHPRTLFTYQ